MINYTVFLMLLVGLSILLGFLLGIRHQIGEDLKAILPVEKQLKEMLTCAEKRRLEQWKVYEEQRTGGAI